MVLSVVLSVVVATVVAGWIMGGAVHVLGPTAAGSTATVVAPHHPATRPEHRRSTQPAAAPNVGLVQLPGSFVLPGGSAPAAPARRPEVPA